MKDGIKDRIEAKDVVVTSRWLGGTYVIEAHLPLTMRQGLPERDWSEGHMRLIEKEVKAYFMHALYGKVREDAQRVKDAVMECLGRCGMDSYNGGLIGVRLANALELLEPLLNAGEETPGDRVEPDRIKSS